MGRNTLNLTVVLLCALLLAPIDAGAAPGKVEQAKAAFKRGNALFARGKYRGARKKYLEAKALYPSPKIDVNLGSTYAEMGNFVKAAEHFHLFLALADPKRSARMIAQVEREMQNVVRQVATVVVACSHDGATVMVDNEPRGTTKLTRPIFLRPGPHSVVVTKEGFDPFRRELNVTGGDAMRLEVNWLDPATGGKPPEGHPADELATRRLRTDTRGWDPFAAEVPAAASSGEGPAASSAGRDRTPVYKKWWFWTVVGAVVVGATTGAVVATQTGGSDRLPAGDSGTITFR